MRDNVKKILAIGITLFSSVIYSGNTQAELKENELTIQNNKEINKEIDNKKRKIEDVVFDLNFDKNLLNDTEKKCLVPFSSVDKSVNLYNNCDIQISGKTISIPLMELQNKIKVVYEQKKPFFYDRIKMNLLVNCSELKKNISFKEWKYYNRNELTLSKEKGAGINWYLTASSEKLGKEMCQEKLPKIVEQAKEELKEKEREKAIKENKAKEKELDKKTKNQSHKKIEEEEHKKKKRVKKEKRDRD